MQWIQDNKEWLFSGIGVAIISLLLGWMFRRGKSEVLNITADRGSVAAKTIKNSTVSTGNTED